MSFWKGFVEWFCGRDESLTSRQFSKMMEHVSGEKKEERKERK